MMLYKKNYSDLILRDYLALDRTELANERTFLSYIRTFISMLAMGLGLVKLTNEIMYIYAGIIFCFISPTFLIIGIYRFYRFKKAVKIFKQSAADEIGKE